MSIRMPLVTIALLLAVPLAAQRGGGGGGGDFGGGAPATAPKTPFQIIADELKLDRKTQLPAVTLPARSQPRMRGRSKRWWRSKSGPSRRRMRC
jgi:hypothetical protein